MNGSPNGRLILETINYEELTDANNYRLCVKLLKS